jgi:hypothetical protein
LKPVTKDANVFTVETSRKYAVAFAEAAQFAEIVVHAALLPAAAVAAAGVAADIVTANVLAIEVPQEFCAVTLMFPFCPEVPVVTVIDVPELAVIDQPVGTTQLYDVALLTAPIE